MEGPAKTGKDSLKDIGLEFARTRSDDAFKRLYERIRPGLENHLYKMAGDRSVAQHLFSCTMGQVHEKIDQYKSDWHISTWIYRIAYVNFCHELRVEKRKNTSLMADVVEGPSASRMIRGEYSYAVSQMDDEHVDSDKEAALDAIPSAVESLPDDLRDIVVRKFYRGETLREISRDTGEPLDLLVKRLNSAKRSIKEACGYKKEPKEKTARTRKPKAAGHQEAPPPAESVDISYKQAAEMLGTSSHVVRTYVCRGKLDGKSGMVKASSVDALLSKREAKKEEKAIARSPIPSQVPDGMVTYAKAAEMLGTSSHVVRTYVCRKVLDGAGGIVSLASVQAVASKRNS